MNLLKTASIVSLFTLASRVTGLVREQLIAAAFGASAATDAFNVAWRLPNFLRRLFAEGAFSQAFVPILAATRNTEGDEVTRTLIDAVGTVLAWALVATAALGVLASPVLVWMIAAGLKEFDLAVLLTRFMFPYIAFISMVALSAGVLNTWKRFAVPAATPVVLNLCVIGAAWLGSPWLAAHGHNPIFALAAGTMLGGLMQLLMQLPALRAIGCLPHIGATPAKVLAAWRHPGVKRVMRQMAPALLGVSVAQISLLVNTQIASRLGVGAVSWLTYADRLMEFPTALLGVALGVVLLPQLSAAQSRGDEAGYSGLLDWGLRVVLVMALPCAVALLLFPAPLLAVLFHYGAFTAADLAQTSRALMGYGAGLMGLVGVKVLAPGFFARQDTRTPVKIAVVVLVVTQILNGLFVGLLGMGHAGLALSIGLGALVNAGWLLTGLRQRGVYRPAPGWGAFGLKVVGASAAMGALLWWANQGFDWPAMRAQPGQRVALLSAVLAGSALLYFGLLAAMGLHPRQFMRRA